MLIKSDIEIREVLPFFAFTGINVCFLVPTETGYDKSIMDAIVSVREMLKEEEIHDYSLQKQGQENKVLIKSYFVNINCIEETYASLYRPNTKTGDPRIWFKNLKKYCSPYNLLAIIPINKELYIINLSKNELRNSLYEKGFVYNIIDKSVDKSELISRELIDKLKEIRNRGFIKSITTGDPGVGDTLENALEISRNNSKLPDYKGIELKATRLTRNGKARVPTRTTLFSKTPDIGLSYREIVEKYGKMQIPKGKKKARLQIYETCRASRKNAYDIQLQIDSKEELLNLIYSNKKTEFISAWIIQNLKDTLNIKHKETFWIKAISEFREGTEYFRYDYIIHTKKPNSSLLPILIENDIITIDLAAHIDNGKYRDHGMLFKIQPKDIPLLFPNPISIAL